jgi:hypothetical protein
MKCIIKLYSKATNKHTNTLMLCGTGTGNFDNHDTYQWVSYPWGTIYPEIFKSKEEALKFFDDKPNVYYEAMRGCQMTLIKENGDYTTATALVSLNNIFENRDNLWKRGEKQND